ncbi:MAG: hypothetical protein AB9835_12085 [Eubacteriales bacterium]
MPKKLFIGIILLIFIIPFLVSPLLFVLNKTGVIELTDIGAKKKPEVVYDVSTSGGRLMNGIQDAKLELDNIYTNYMPMYGLIVRSYSSVELALDNAFDDFLELLKSDNSGTATTEAPSGVPGEDTTQKGYEPVYEVERVGTDDLYNIYKCDVQLEDGSWESFLETAILKSHSELADTMDTQIEQINRIANLNDKVNFYVYIESRFQDTDLFAEIFTKETSTRVLRDNFLSRLDAKIKYDYMDLDTVQSRISHVFKTDHHWAADGIYDGYVQIINMISADSPEIGKPREKGELYTFEGNVWYGSRSRRSLYYGINDVLSVYDHHLPEHQVRDFEGAKPFDKMLEIYKNGDYDKRKHTDHYEAFFPRPRKVTYPENNTGHNLLIIGDSYSWAGTELIASNFDSTYVFLPWTREEFDYNGYIEKYNITDVIIMQFSDRIMFDIYNDCPLYNIK